MTDNLFEKLLDQMDFDLELRQSVLFKTAKIEKVEVSFANHQ